MQDRAIKWSAMHWKAVMMFVLYSEVSGDMRLGLTRRTLRMRCCLKPASPTPFLLNSRAVLKIHVLSCTASCSSCSGVTPLLSPRGALLAGGWAVSGPSLLARCSPPALSNCSPSSAPRKLRRAPLKTTVMHGGACKGEGEGRGVCGAHTHNFTSCSQRFWRSAVVRLRRNQLRRNCGLRRISALMASQFP